MPKTPVLVVDWEPSTSRLFNDMFILEGHPYRHEPDVRKAFDFLRRCKKPHVVLIRYQMKEDRDRLYWYTLLPTMRRLQRHAYIETWACCDYLDVEPRLSLAARFGILILPCPPTSDQFFDAFENACARLAHQAH